MTMVVSLTMKMLEVFFVLMVLLKILTAPYTPEQNGIAKRDNRMIVEMARTLKYSNSDMSIQQAYGQSYAKQQCTF